jgi:Tol biopolymer transport system component
MRQIQIRRENMNLRPWTQVVLILVCLAAALPALAATTERVSVSSAGEQGNSDSGYPAISADGRYVAFKSAASNLVPGDTNGTWDIFVQDRLTGVTERVSVSTAGDEGNDYSDCPAISADGRYVAFVSSASNLVAGDTNGASDIFVHDRLTGVTERVSVSTAGDEGNDESDYPAISDDGRYVAFDSNASNLGPDDTNSSWDVFVHDRLTGATERVSVSSTGEQGNDFSYYAAISADGRYIAFASDASNLVAGDTNGREDVFVHDVLTDATERASVSTAGEEANGTSTGAAISADGRYVGFLSSASNLVSGDTNGEWDIFVHDGLTGVTERVSVSSTGEEGNTGSENPSSTSADGRYVAFPSNASNLVPDDTNGTTDVFVHDRLTGASERVSVSAAGEEANGGSGGAAISADGRCVAFASEASNLVLGDTNGVFDVFVRKRWTFRDVLPDFWAYAHIEACYDAGIVAGYLDETYRPAEPVDRGQMAVYIARALTGGDEYVPTGPATATFPDVPTTHWAFKYVEYCHDQAVVQGYWDGYHPDEVVNRAQMAVYVARALVVPTGDAAIPDPPGPPTFPDVPATYWAYKWIEYCHAQGVVQGYWDGYRPEETVNRAQMAVYVQRAFNLPM